MHLMKFTRPHIAYIVCRLSRYTHNHNKDHWFALNRLMKYLIGNMNYGIMYSGFPSTLEGFMMQTGSLIQMRQNPLVVCNPVKWWRNIVEISKIDDHC